MNSYLLTRSEFQLQSWLYMYTLPAPCMFVGSYKE